MQEEKINKKLILVIGAPGSGKTTNANLIAEKYLDKFVHFSTGDLLRSEIASKSELGNTINTFVSKGDLVPLNIVLKSIVQAIENSNKSNVIIDGYPRDEAQMHALDESLAVNKNVTLVSVVEINITENTAQNRVLGRNRGDDDNIEIFNNRMLVFKQPLEAIKSFYRSKNLLTTISGEDSIEAVLKTLDEHIQSVL